MKIDIYGFDGFIFDMDGVIVDNYRYHIEAWGEFFRRKGIGFDATNFTKIYFGKNNTDILQSLYGKTLAEAEIEELGEEKETIYRELYQPHIKPLEGLIGLMEQLKSYSKKIAIASSAPQSNIEFVVENTGIAKYIDAIVNGNMVKHGKPNPDIFLKAAQLIKLPPAKCLVFEDSFSGIQAAKNAGMQVIAVATTHTKDEHDQTLTIVENFNEIL